MPEPNEPDVKETIEGLKELTDLMEAINGKTGVFAERAAKIETDANEMKAHAKESLKLQRRLVELYERQVDAIEHIAEHVCDEDTGRRLKYKRRRRAEPESEEAPDMPDLTGMPDEIRGAFEDFITRLKDLDGVDVIGVKSARRRR